MIPLDKILLLCLKTQRPGSEATVKKEKEKKTFEWIASQRSPPRVASSRRHLSDSLASQSTKLTLCPKRPSLPCLSHTVWDQVIRSWRSMVWWGGALVQDSKTETEAIRPEPKQLNEAVTAKRQLSLGLPIFTW